jgi:hypothetical protein
MFWYLYAEISLGYVQHLIWSLLLGGSYGLLFVAGTLCVWLANSNVLVVCWDLSGLCATSGMISAVRWIMWSALCGWHIVCLTSQDSEKKGKNKKTNFFLVRMPLWCILSSHWILHMVVHLEEPWLEKPLKLLPWCYQAVCSTRVGAAFAKARSPYFVFDLCGVRRSEQFNYRCQYSLHGQSMSGEILTGAISHSREELHGN